MERLAHNPMKIQFLLLPLSVLPSSCDYSLHPAFEIDKRSSYSREVELSILLMSLDVVVGVIKKRG